MEQARQSQAGWRIAGFAAGYFAITSLTIGLSRYGGGLALVWLGTAVAAAMLLDLPRRLWPAALAAIMLASAAATSAFGFGTHMAAPLAPINALEAWLVARLMLFARPGRDWFEDVTGLAWFIAIGGLVAPALAAVPGGIAASYAAPGAWPHHALSWWAAHGLGTLIGLPIVVLIRSASLAGMRSRTSVRAALRLAGHLALVLAVALLAIGQSALPLLFLPVVPLLLASFRCGREGAVLGALIVAGVTVWAGSRGTSPIAPYALSAGDQVLFLQAYLATLSLLAIPVSVALRQHQSLLAEVEERRALKSLIEENSDDALLNLDEHGRIRYASPAGARLTGEPDLIGHGLARFFDPLDEPLVRLALAQAAAAPGDTRIIERPVLCGDEQLWLQAKLRAVAPDNKPSALQGYAVTIRDVSTRKRTELDAIEAAETDQLTGLPNRRVLIHQLESALAHAAQRPFALAILDLDHFKAINDTHGHVIGDAVLREVSKVMRRLSGPSRFFARLGGEEFALVSRQRDFREVEQLCERLRRECAQLIFTASDGSRFSPTASIGLARIAIGMTPPEALQIADTLLYAAKNSGRNRVRTAPLPRLAGTPGRKAA